MTDAIDTVNREMLGVLARDDVLIPDTDSNYGRCITATAERVFSTQYLKRVFTGHHPMGPGIEYPNAGVYPGEPPEEEYTNMSNQVIYGVNVTIATVGVIDPWSEMFRLLSIREVVLDVCRTKDRIDMKPGDIHENTLVYSPALILPIDEEGKWIFTTGFTVNYIVTEVRKEEL